MGDCVMRIPLRGHGDVVRAYALVDAEDYEWLNQWRWHLHNRGYAGRKEYLGKIGGRYRDCGVLMHRAILGLVRGDPRSTDHVSGDKLDNRRANLRPCTHSENHQNRRPMSGTSQYMGVSWHRRAGKWMGQAVVGGEYYYLGLFTDEEEAARVVANFRRDHMPFSREAQAKGADAA